MRGWRKAPYILLRGAARVFELVVSALTYLAAGTLRLRDLQEAIANAWEDYGRAESYILSGLLPAERALYDRFLKPAHRILVVGCGSGREVIALLKLGHHVEGLDIAPRAIALAHQMLEKEGLRAKLHTGRIEDVELAGGFDAFFFSWFCYGYIPQADTRIGMLRKVKAHLNPGGRILIGYTPAEPPPRSLPIRLTRLAARLTRVDWRPEHGDVIGTGSGGRRSVQYEHQFADGEFEKEARAADLAVVFHDRGNGTAVLTA